MENLEELKNKYEGKLMIAKISDMFGVKKKNYYPHFSYSDR